MTYYSSRNVFDSRVKSGQYFQMDNAYVSLAFCQYSQVQDRRLTRRTFFPGAISMKGGLSDDYDL